jgi:hypothetical protein
MRRRLAFAVLLLAALGLAVTTSAGKPAKPPQGTPVTVTFTDETGYAIQSDGDGAYINGTDGVTAQIVPLGNLQLKTGTVRTFWLDFGACAQGPCDPPSFLADFRQGYMTTSCGTALLDMGVNASQECNLNVHFTADQLGWFIRFGEEYGTTPASVARVSLDSWTIDVQVGGIALLESYPLKGRVTWTPHGYYDMPVNLATTLLP